jgi:hypothetical protein
MNQEHRLEDAGADLRTAISSMPFPPLRTRQGRRGWMMAFVGAAAVALLIGIPAFLARTQAPGGGTVAGATDTTTTTRVSEVTATSTPETTTTTTITRVNPSYVCGAELPWGVGLPEDFTGPHEGPSPHSSDTAEDGQLIVHWLGRDGSVEIRWPANTKYIEDAEWGAPMEWDGGNPEDFALFLFADPHPETLQTVGATEVLPTEIMETPCDAAQLKVFASEEDAAFSAGNGATFGESENADVVIYPNLPRLRDKVLIVETVETSNIPEVVTCQGGPEVEDVPPNKTGNTPNGSTFDTPEDALQDLLSTEVADTWPKKGYFKLVTPDGNIVFGNPYDDMSPEPRPSNGLVISVTVDQVYDGWTVTQWETSGC